MHRFCCDQDTCKQEIFAEQILGLVEVSSGHLLPDKYYCLPHDRKAEWRGLSRQGVPDLYPRGVAGRE